MFSLQEPKSPEEVRTLVISGMTNLMYLINLVMFLYCIKILSKNTSTSNNNKSFNTSGCLYNYKN